MGERGGLQVLASPAGRPRGAEWYGRAWRPYRIACNFRFESRYVFRPAKAVGETEPGLRRQVVSHARMNGRLAYAQLRITGLGMIRGPFSYSSLRSGILASLAPTGPCWLQRPRCLLPRGLPCNHAQIEG